mmetsp:Transcript_37283/g.59882  ORF Transcript_37283/g.59882 Transcript_37283/m.59882 type:complete len:413 (-) Transcript_37283:514-1752(-)
MLVLSLAALAAFAPFVYPLDVPPEWARGGQLYAKFMHKQNFESREGLTEEVLQLPLDHFGKQDGQNRTIGIRYWVDETCYSKGSPVFVKMGGEGAAGPSFCDSRASKHSALVLAVEHRFYGKSVPTGSEPLSLENLQYLTVEQNLADTKAILDHVTAKYKAGTGFAFGGSYSGATCAWFRLTYPESVSGCISESGVVNAILNFTKFDYQVSTALSKKSLSCRSDIVAAFAAVDRQFSKGRGSEIKAMFNANNLNGSQNGDPDFMYAIADGVAMMDQYGSKDEVCAHVALLPASPSDDDRISNLNEMIIKHYGNDFVKGCFYDSDCIKNKVVGASQGVGDRSWRWQKCSELAYLQTAPDENRARSTLLTLDALVQQCEYMFNGTLPDTTGINQRYGGDQPKGSQVRKGAALER